MFKLFKAKEKPIRTYEDFWKWFRTNENSFFEVLKKEGNVERDFANKLFPKLSQLKEGFFFLAGMINERVAELILTVDGTIKHIPFVEDLVQKAPNLDNWNFTALKPALNIENVRINMAGYDFNSQNLSFYSIGNDRYPDEIDIVVAHEDLNEDNRSVLTNGIGLFLDNFLGELNFAVTIDNLTTISSKHAKHELIPIHKLKDYLVWREKEFVEKYEAVYYKSENNRYAGLEAEMQNGNPMMAVINSDLLEWNHKPSHPWILDIDINYDGSQNKGFPDDVTYKKLDELENELMLVLKDSDGYLNIGRQTADSHRNIYFACKEFRNASRVADEILEKYRSVFDGNYELYKDKYWHSFDRFIPSLP
ncbi:MAG: DUF695 domain-containing protein [Bacteroidota bacterium]